MVHRNDNLGYNSALAFGHFLPSRYLGPGRCRGSVPIQDTGDDLFVLARKGWRGVVDREEQRPMAVRRIVSRGQSWNVSSGEVEAASSDACGTGDADDCSARGRTGRVAGVQHDVVAARRRSLLNCRGTMMKACFGH